MHHVHSSSDVPGSASSDLQLARSSSAIPDSASSELHHACSSSDVPKSASADLYPACYSSGFPYLVSGNFYQAPSSFDSPAETFDDLSSFPLLDAALAADNEIILNTPLATMPAITVELPKLLKPPEEFFKAFYCLPRILDEALFSKNIIFRMVFGTCVMGV